MKQLFFLTSFFILLILSCSIGSGDKFDAAKNTERYYGKNLEAEAEKFRLPVNYLKALTAIEVSGKKIIPHRFEEHVYEKLVRVKDGKLDRFENITPDLLKDIPDSTLRDMAKSWGPFQIMGYKCVFLTISVEELKTHSMFYGARWIDISYGDRLRAGDYKNCFHLHNAGKLYPDSGPPLTYDKDYVKNGLKYMKYFHYKDSLKAVKNDSISIRL